MSLWKNAGSRKIVLKRAHRIPAVLLSLLMLLSLCACSSVKETAAPQQMEKQAEQEETVTLDSVFSLMTNGSTEMCLDRLKKVENDPDAAEWLSFTDAVKEDRFDDAKALFLRLTDSWEPEAKSLIRGKLYGLTRFISRWCKECGVESLRYLCLAEHAGISGTDVTELCRNEAKQELAQITTFGAPAWRISREEYQQLLGRCGTDPKGAVLIAVDPGGNEVIVWTGMMALMPDGYFSDDPANIEYLIRIEQGQSYQGTYNNNTKAYGRTCTVSLSRIPSGAVLFSRSYEPHNAPKTYAATKKDTYGNAFTMNEVQDGLCEAISRLLDYYADDFRFLPGAGGTAICFCYSGNESSLSIPAEIKGRPVTEIADHFAAASGVEEQLTAVTLPDSVRRIGNYAFAKCTKLETVRMPAELEVIKGDAFRETPSLTSVDLPDTCTAIHDYAFTASGLRELRIPAGMERISSYAFASCKNLVSLEIPENIRWIGTHAFANCSGLVHLVISDRCEEIGASAFENCENLREAAIPPSAAVKTNAFRGCSLPDQPEQ